MRAFAGVLLLALVATASGQPQPLTGENVRPLATDIASGAEAFEAGTGEGVCVCGSGANTAECLQATQSFCQDKGNAKVCAQMATFNGTNASQTDRVAAGKFLADYLIQECKYKFPKKTSGCDCVEDPDSTACHHAAWEACRRGNSMCPAMHFGEQGGAGSMNSFARFIQAKCNKGLAETNMEMKYEEMDEATWNSTVREGTAKSLSNITGLPSYMISEEARQVMEDNMEPIQGGNRKMLSASGFVQKQVTKMVVKYTMRSLMKKQSGVEKSLSNAAANNGQGFFDTFNYYGVSARPFMSGPSINNGAWFGGPLAAAGAGGAGGAGGASGATSGASGGLTGGQIAGIVIGSVVGALLLGLLPLLCCLLCLKKKKKDKTTTHEKVVVEEKHRGRHHGATPVGKVERREVRDPETGRHYYEEHDAATGRTWREWRDPDHTGRTTREWRDPDTGRVHREYRDANTNSWMAHNDDVPYEKGVRTTVTDDVGVVRDTAREVARH